jgi:hypothetical protein
LSGSDENRAMVCLIALADQVAGRTGFGFGSCEASASFEDTEAFLVLAGQASGTMASDLAGSFADLHQVTKDIEEIHALMCQM